MNVSPLQDAEFKRQQKNMTLTQKKTNLSTKEGVLVNNFIKDNQCNLNDTYNSMIISEQTKLPKKIYENQTTKEKNLLPLAGISVAVMGTVALLSTFVKKNAKNVIGLAKEKWLPTVTRNVNLSEETTQAIYQMVQNPGRTSVIAGTGVLALSAMAFMGKMFCEGYKEIWVKRKEADIQKNLQEKLIDVETQAFSGKIQIIRSMLSKQAHDFEKYLTNDNDKILPNFGKKVLNSNGLYFMGENNKKDPKTNNLKYIFMGLGTISSIIGLGYFAFKNASKSRALIDKYLQDTEKCINQVVKSSNETTKQTDKETLENLFKILDADKNFIKSKLLKIKWSDKEKEDFIENVYTKIQTSTTKVNPNIGGDGTSKPAFNSFVNDYRAFFYNWLLDTSNPQFKQLFFGVTGVTAAGYAGKLYGDAMKDVQVKKINAETELDLQKRLVSTELRNFKSKKEAAIQPLVDEFYKQVDNGKPKEELKVMADNILFEIKNGPPFVYS